MIRQRWSAIEPTSTTIDWTFIDQQIARAKKHKKKYVLGINTGNNAPRWLGVPLYQEAPYPWDPTMLEAHGRMVKKLGERYAGDPDLVGVHLSGPTRGPSGSLEMQLAVGLTREKDYSEARVITAWQTCIDQYAQAFPDWRSFQRVAWRQGAERLRSRRPSSTICSPNTRIARTCRIALKAGTQEQALHHRVVVNMGRRGCRIGFEMVGPSVGGKNGQKGRCVDSGDHLPRPCSWRSAPMLNG